MIGWSKYRLGLPSAPLHYGLMWSVGIPTVFQTQLSHSPPCTALMPAVRAVQGDCERVQTQEIQDNTEISYLIDRTTKITGTSFACRFMGTSLKKHNRTVCRLSTKRRTTITNSLVPDKYGSKIWQVYFSNCYEFISYALSVKLVFGECHQTPLMTSQHWFG